MVEKEKRESLSSRALAAFIEEKGLPFVAKQTDLHRTQLWRYAQGWGKPNAEQVAILDRVSEGRVAANGWETLETETKPAAE